MKKIGLALTILMLLSCGQIKSLFGTDDEPSYSEIDIRLEDGQLIHYYFSVTTEGIEKAVKDTSGINLKPPLKNANWELNPILSINVRGNMEAKGVNYSACYMVQNYETYLIVNRRYDNKYYIAGYTLY